MCGNDGVTYPSACHLRKATCTSGVQQAHSGACLDLTRPEECPFNCPEEEEEGGGADPVCGSDGNVYASECHLRLLTCGQRVATAPRTKCQATKSVGREKNHINAAQSFPQFDFMMDFIKFAEIIVFRPSFFFVRYCDADCSADASSDEDDDSEEDEDRKKSKMVCGSDGQFYPSRCHMRKENCG